MSMHSKGCIRRNDGPPNRNVLVLKLRSALRAGLLGAGLLGDGLLC